MRTIKVLKATCELSYQNNLTFLIKIMRKYIKKCKVNDLLSVDYVII